MEAGHDMTADTDLAARAAQLCAVFADEIATYTHADPTDVDRARLAALLDDRHDALDIALRGQAEAAVLWPTPDPAGASTDRAASIDQNLAAALATVDRKIAALGWTKTVT